MQVSDFKLALYGQIYDSEGLMYAYPDKVAQFRNSGQYPAWINALPFDTRFLRELALPGGECFSVRYAKDGLYCSYTKYNPHDSRNGVVSIALYTQNKIASDAKQLIAVLRNLMEYFLVKNSAIGIQDAEVESYLKGVTESYLIRIPTSEVTVSSLDAYRIYQTEEDLQKLLKWAIQKEYMRYKWVHFVSAQNKKPIINPTLYTELSSRLVECYVITGKDGNELATSGESRTITYRKDGYMEQTIKFVVGQPSPYVTVDANNVVHIKAQNELNMKFKKEMTIQLFDASTGAPIVENGMQVCHKVEVEDGKRQSVFLTARGYLPKTINIDSTAIPGAKGTMSQSLQKEKKNGGWNDDFGGDEHEEYLRVRKKPLIITTLALALITLIVGFGIGFALQRYVLASDTLATAKVAGDSTQAKLTEEIKSLKDSISNLNKKNEGLEKQIKDKDKQIDKLNKNKKTTAEQDEKSKQNEAIATANEKALAYLNSTNEWSLQGLTKASEDRTKVGLTDCYKFLKRLVQGQELEEVIKEDFIENSMWKDDIKPIIGTKLRDNKNRIIQYIKEANTNATKTPTELQNGTLKLQKLYNKLTEL